ncbi:hypothetical protein [Ammoniphilus sp. CFH 90114]|uniref:hypothetical protein n=1 Tax=Ammoniphilus sp. CFH 90114 TaxID=2493665 RepID=UPI001F0C89EE|nr:hypothetical protein [Ammoniphilus sp. CFH 90114]
MNYEMDYDRDREQISRDQIAGDHLTEILESSLELETELMRTYLITAERIHEDPVLKDRLQNFAEGNAKRTRQLMEELNQLKN